MYDSYLEIKIIHYRVFWSISRPKFLSIEMSHFKRIARISQLLNPLKKEIVLLVSARQF